MPTSAGYGGSLEGVAALLGMLASCESALVVVDIDNGSAPRRSLPASPARLETMGEMPRRKLSEVAEG